MIKNQEPVEGQEQVVVLPKPQLHPENDGQDFSQLGLMLLCRDSGLPNSSVVDNQSLITPSDIGRVIRLRREESAMSRRALAEVSNVSSRTIAAVEKGKPSVGIGNILALLRVLGIEMRLGG